MSRSTYTARMRLSSEDNFMVEPPFTATAGHPYYVGPAAMAVFNKPASGKVVYVESMNVKPLATGQNATNVVILQRCSAASGGELLTFGKSDSGFADLPSQVEARTFPDSVTVVGSSAIRRLMLQARWHATAALATFVARATGASAAGFDSSEVASFTDAAVQPYVLREGEGLVLTNVNDHSHMGYALSFLLKDATNNRTYRVRDLIDPLGGSASHIFSLLNGSGSGIVLEVHRIQLRETGSYEVPIGTWELIEALDDDAEALPPSTVLPHDSTLPLNSGVLVKANTRAVKAGFRSGGLITLPVFHRAQLTEPPFGAGVTGLQLGRRGKFAKDFVANGETKLALREGCGLALFMRNSSSLFVHEAQITFTVADVIPAVGDVRTGTVYGNDQELTGTLSPGGGGGNTYSRARVVNV